MAKETVRNTRLGIFVIAGTALLLLALYLIGSKQNLFNDTLRVSATFHNVNGLTRGHNVRYAGIDVGTVQKVEIISDTEVRVVMLIDKEAGAFIRKNAVASIGTDGIMGNKLVNINSLNLPAPAIGDDDLLASLDPIETDEMLRTLHRTNENISLISDNVRSMSDRMNSRNSFWSLLMDTVMAQNVKEAIVNIKMTGNNTAVLTGDMSDLMDRFKPGKGTLASLLSDTSMGGRIEQTLVNVKMVSDSIALVSGDLRELSKKVRSGEGTVGMLLSDSAFEKNLNRSMQNIEQGSASFRESMEGLQHSFLLRRYFREKAKQEKKTK